MAVKMTEKKSTAALLAGPQVKTKEKTGKEKYTKPTTTKEAVDQYADLTAQLTGIAAVVKGLTKKKADAQELLEKAVENVAPDETDILEGSKFDIEASEKQNVATLKDTAFIREKIGDELFFKIASVGVGDLEKYVEPKVLAEILSRERTGRRSFKVIPKV